MVLLEDQMLHGALPRRCPPAQSRLEIDPRPRPVARGTCEAPDAWPRWHAPPRIERETVLVPRAVALAVWEEASQWLGEELPRAWLTLLTERAEAVYASNRRVRRRLRGPGNGGREWLWAFTRHWLAALIWRHRRALHVRLPATYNMGCPLPEQQTALARQVQPSTPKLTGSSMTSTA